MKRFVMIASVFVVACSGAGMGEGVRKDVTARMQSAQPDLAACYKAALERKRKLRGQMVLAFDAAPKSGVFQNVRVVRDEVGDPALAGCVVERVSTLKLATPQKTGVAIESYPVDFAPEP